MNHPRLLRLIDFDQPLALLLTGILLFVPDEDDPHGLVARYLDAIASGSYLVIVHGGSDAQPEREAAHTALYQRSGTPIWLRTRDQITAFFNGTELVEPGLVFTPFWRPESPVDSDVTPGRTPTAASAASPDPARRASPQNPQCGAHS